MLWSDNHLFKLLALVEKIYCPAPKPKRGHPFQYAEVVILKVFLLMVLKRITEQAALYRYLAAHPGVRAACGLEHLPDESTLRKRLKKLSPALKCQLPVWARHVMHKTACRSEAVAVDKKMISSQGPLWHQRDREQNQIPKNLRGVDKDSSWSKSAYRGWVQGYGLHVAVTASPGSPLIPVWADFCENTSAESQVAVGLAEHLPAQIRRVLGDESYDSQVLREALQRYEDGLLERALVVPIKVCPRSPQKRRREADRYEREKWLYKQRAITIEPFFDRLDQCFQIEPAWQKGLKNNKSIGLLWIAGYLLMMLYLSKKGENPEHIKQLIDIL